MIIRFAQKSDLPAIADLAREMIDYHHALDPYYKAAAGYVNLEGDLGKELTDKNSLFLIAEQNKEILGYFRGSVDPSPNYVEPEKIGVVYDLFVTEKQRGRSIGSRLLDEALSWFKKKKAKNIELNVDTRNPAGIAFWKRHGFADYKLRLRRDL